MRTQSRSLSGTRHVSTPADPAPPHPYRWAVLFGVWLIYFSFGLSIASMGPLVAEITRDLGMSLSVMGLVLTKSPFGPRLI